MPSKNSEKTGPKGVSVGVRIPTVTLEKIDRIAAQSVARGATRGDIIRALLDEALEHREEKR